MLHMLIIGIRENEIIIFVIRDSWFVIFVVCESCLGPPSPPPSLYDPLHNTSWLNWQTNNNQGCALRAPGHLRRLTFGLGRLKIFLGRPARRPAGVVFLIYSQKTKRKCCSGHFVFTRRLNVAITRALLTSGLRSRVLFSSKVALNKHSGYIFQGTVQ